MPGFGFSLDMMKFFPFENRQSHEFQKNHDDSALNLSNFLLNDTSYETAVTNCHYLAYNKFSRDIMADRVETALLEAVND